MDNRNVNLLLVIGALEEDSMRPVFVKHMQTDGYITKSALKTLPKPTRQAFHEICEKYKIDLKQIIREGRPKGNGNASKLSVLSPELKRAVESLQLAEDTLGTAIGDYNAKRSDTQKTTIWLQTAWMSQ